MATYNLGRVGLNIRGEYSSNSQYERLDVVTSNGSSYVAKANCSGIPLTNNTYWSPLANGLPQINGSGTSLYNIGLQYGVVPSTSITKSTYTDVAITFPKPFLAGTEPICFPVFWTGSTAAAMANVSVVAYTTTNSGFTARCFNNSSTTRIPRIHWLAFGTPDPTQMN